MQRFSTLRRTGFVSSTTLAGKSPGLLSGLLVSCCIVALSQPANAQSVAIDNAACPANPGAVVDNGGGDGLAISGAADCPAGTTPAAQVNDDGGIAIGNDRANPTITAGNGNSIAIGNGARGGTAGSSNAVALGTGANAISTGSVAIGQGAVAGSLTDLTRVNLVAIGTNAAATAQNSTAIGTGSIANGPQATAIGSAASAGVNSTATGRLATAGNSAVAYGVNANAGLRGTALGQGATATVMDSTAIGSFASSTVANSVALGRLSIASRGAQASYTGYGLTAPQTSLGEVSIGTAAGQRQLTGVAAGSASTDAVNVSQLTAIDAQADLLGSNVATALGSGAAYDAATGALTAPAYSVQGASQTNVGAALTALDTQVTTNTADIATNATDIATNTTNIAANTADIDSLETGIGNGTIGLVQQAAPGADLTVGAASDGAAVSFAGTAGDRRLTGIAAGAVSAGSTEAINGDQLAGTAQTLADALGGGASVNADGTVASPAYAVQGGSQSNVGDALTALDGQLTTNTADIATNTTNIATNTADIDSLETAVGNGTIGLVQQVAPGADLTVGAATDGTTVSFAGTGGDRALTGIAAGTVSATSNQAINGSQLFAGNSSLAAALGGGATVNADGTIAAPSYTVQGAIRTNVGDALTALDDQVTTNTDDIADLASAIGSGTVGLVQQVDPTAQVTVAAATGGSSVSFAGTAGNRTLTGVANGAVVAGSVEAVNGGQLAGTAQSVATALGGGAAVNADGSVSAPTYAVQGGVQTSVGGALTALDTQVTTNTTAIARLESEVAGLGAAIESGTVGLVQQAGAGSPLTVGAGTDGDTVDFTGTAGDRTLTGIAAGTVSATSTDAINGSQLNATNLAIQSVADLVTGQGGGFASNNAAGAAVPLASGADSSAGGNGAVASGQQATAVGNNATATGTQSTAIGYAASATGNNSIAIGAGSSDAGEDDVVSVGSATTQRRITNVAPGFNPTDAVNVGQLNTSLSQTLASANAYTDARFADMAFDIDEVRRDSEGATAASMALAGIPQSFERGMGMVGMGVGTWQGESAVALGVSKATDNGRVVFKAGATYNTRGQGGANGGVGFAF